MKTFSLNYTHIFFSFLCVGQYINLRPSPGKLWCSILKCLDFICDWIHSCPVVTPTRFCKSFARELRALFTTISKDNNTSIRDQNESRIFQYTVLDVSWVGIHRYLGHQFATTAENCRWVEWLCYSKAVWQCQGLSKHSIHTSVAKRYGLANKTSFRAKTMEVNFQKFS